MPTVLQRERLRIGAPRRPAELVLPADAAGLVLLAHGGAASGPHPGSGFVAGALQAHGVGTLRFELLAPDEVADRGKAGDIELLARRIEGALTWAMEAEATARLRLGVHAADAGTAAALRAAAGLADAVCAVVLHGGRPDLAGAAALARVDAPTLLIVGGADAGALARHRDAMRQMRCRKRLEVVPGASDRFDEPGALDAAAHLAGAWFATHLSARFAA